MEEVDPVKTTWRSKVEGSRTSEERGSGGVRWREEQVKREDQVERWN